MIQNRDDENPDKNLRIGLLVVVSFFLVISVLAFPNGELFDANKLRIIITNSNYNITKVLVMMEFKH